MVCGQSRKPFNRKGLQMNSQTNQTSPNEISEATRKRLEAQLADRNVSDSQNPVFIFSMTSTDLLLAAAAGLIDLNQLAREQLADRGLDANGKWIGFDNAARIWEVER